MHGHQDEGNLNELRWTMLNHCVLALFWLASPSSSVRALFDSSNSSCLVASRERRRVFGGKSEATKTSPLVLRQIGAQLSLKTTTTKEKKKATKSQARIENFLLFLKLCFFFSVPYPYYDLLPLLVVLYSFFLLATNFLGICHSWLYVFLSNQQDQMASFFFFTISLFNREG